MKQLLQLFIITSLASSCKVDAQPYIDSIKAYQQDYVTKHEVVKGHDKTYFRFYPADRAFRVEASFTPAIAADWISFKTSGTQNKLFKLYGTLTFKVADTEQQLNLYQSQQTMSAAGYQTYLFLPFTDATTGKETYTSGRYIDLQTSDIKNGKLLLDFNKAYNPYCAYVDGVYNCPIPPRENTLTVAVKAGEKNYAKPH